jgi:nitrosocyanin
MQESTEMNMGQKNNSQPFVLLAIVALVAIVGVGAIMARGKSASSTTEVAPSTTPEVMVASPEISPVVSPVATPGSMTGTPTGSTTADSAVKTFNIEAGSFYFKPNELRVKKGDKVKIVMTAVSMMHDFNIDELGVKMPIVNNGKTGTVEFTASKAGTFQYYCSVGQHRKMGQVGTLIVE